MHIFGEVFALGKIAGVGYEACTGKEWSLYDH
jgi:hypothetical protein